MSSVGNGAWAITNEFKSGNIATGTNKIFFLIIGKLCFGGLRLSPCHRVISISVSSVAPFAVILLGINAEPHYTKTSSQNRIFTNAQPHVKHAHRRPGGAVKDSVGDCPLRPHGASVRPGGLLTEALFALTATAAYVLDFGRSMC